LLNLRRERILFRNVLEELPDVVTVLCPANTSSKSIKEINRLVNYLISNFNRDVVPDADHPRGVSAVDVAIKLLDRLKALELLLK
jgi:hypothetical protein